MLCFILKIKKRAILDGEIRCSTVPLIYKIRESAAIAQTTSANFIQISLVSFWHKHTKENVKNGTTHFTIPGIKTPPGTTVVIKLNKVISTIPDVFFTLNLRSLIIKYSTVMPTHSIEKIKHILDSEMPYNVSRSNIV